VNPFIASHGGSIHLVEMRGSVARVEMEGGCQGCAAARGTLNEIVERMLRADVPGLEGVEDVTDHGAGENPFFPRSTSGTSSGFGLAPGTTPPPVPAPSSKRRTDLAVAAGRV
jgi:Fe-S cluster biogenesis protein NfuA